MQPQLEHGPSTTTPAVGINGVNDLLPFLQGAPVTYRFKKRNVTLEGFIADGGYACACDASSSCEYRGKVLSALKFEKHAGPVTKNQNAHIFLRNGASLYGLFHALRAVPAERFAEAFRMAAGVPMAAPASAGVPPAQGQQPGSREPDRLQAVDLTAEHPPSAAAQEPQTSEMLTEEEKASLSLLDLRAHIVVTELDPMDIIEEPFVHHMLNLRDAAEEIENAVCHDHAMPDVGEIRNAAGEQPRDSDLLTAAQVKVQVTETKYQPVRAAETKYQPVRVAETKYQPESLLKDVRGLLSTGLLEGFRVTYRKNGVEMTGRIDGQGYSCGCSECGYRNTMNACEFEQHADQSSNNQNAHIFLDSGISLYKLIQVLKYKKLYLLVDLIEEQIGLPPNLIEYRKWKASFQVEDDDLDDAASDPCSTQSSQESAAGVTSHTAFATTLTDCLKEPTSNGSPNLNWSSFRRPRWQYKRGVSETSTRTLSRRSEKGATGLSTGASMKSNTEETPSENTTGPHSSEVIKPIFAVPAAVISTSAECDPINLPFSLSSPVSVVQEPPPDHSVDSKSKEFRPPKVRDNSLHQLVFKESGLPDLTLLTYKLKNGEVLKQGYKRGTGIVCGCCNEEFTPSQFENHAGMGRRRQPYRSIYTSGGLTLHKLALKLQDGLNSNEISSGDVSDIDEPPNLSCSGSSKESSASDRPIIVPLKRTLQERVVNAVSCHLCGDARTTVGAISEDMIVFCNQCERPCHIKCYNNGLEKQKAPSNILGEYMQFYFLCCQKCQLLRASLHQELHKREKTRLKRSKVCWQLLSGMNPRSNIQQYMHQVMEIFKDAFPETAACDSDVIHDMVNGNICGEKDFRGMYCAVLTTSSKLVVSAAILKVHTEEVAELVLVATRNNCRKKGYFTLLLRQIEAHLKALNVRLLTAPVDPEMASIWSEKLGFTILSDEKESLLETHPLVMFEDLTLMQKSLADKPDLMVSRSEVTVGESSAQFS